MRIVRPGVCGPRDGCNLKLTRESGWENKVHRPTPLIPVSPPPGRACPVCRNNRGPVPLNGCHTTGPERALFIKKLRGILKNPIACTQSTQDSVGIPGSYPIHVIAASPTKNPRIVPPFRGGSPAWGFPDRTKYCSNKRPASEPMIAPSAGRLMIPPSLVP